MTDKSKTFLSILFLLVISAMGSFNIAHSREIKEYQSNWHSILNDNDLDLRGLIVEAVNSDSFQAITITDTSIGWIKGQQNLLYNYEQITTMNNSQLLDLSPFPDTFKPSFLLLTKNGVLFHYGISSDFRHLEKIGEGRITPEGTLVKLKTFTCNRVNGLLTITWIQQVPVNNMYFLHWSILNPGDYSLENQGFLPLDEAYAGFDHSTVTELRIDNFNNLLATLKLKNEKSTESALLQLGSFDINNGKVVFKKLREAQIVRRFKGFEITGFDYQPGPSGNFYFISKDKIYVE